MSNNVYTPKEAESVRKVENTPEDRTEFQKQWKEDKEHKQRLKEERFARIQERRGKKNLGDSGGGINIEVTSDS